MKNIVAIWKVAGYAIVNSESWKSARYLLILISVLSQLLAYAIEKRQGRQFDPLFYAESFGISMIVVLAAGAMIWNFTLTQKISFLFSPVNAGLLPYHRRHMQVATGLPIVFAAIVAVIANLFIEHSFSLWPALSLVIALVFALVVTRSPWALLLFLFSFQLVGFLKKNNIVNVESKLESVTGLPFNLILAGLLFLMIYAGCHWTFSIRADAIYTMQRRAKVWGKGIRSEGIHESRGFRALSTFFIRWMDFRVAISRKAGASLAQKKGLLVFSFGPRLHSFAILGQSLAVLIVGFAVMFLANAFFGNKSIDFFRGFGTGLGSVILMMQPLIFALVFFDGLFQTRTEQALVMLSPYVEKNGQADTLFRRFLLRQFLILYSFSVVVVLMLLYWAIELNLHRAYVLLFVCTIFPVILMVTGEYGKMKSRADRSSFKLTIVCVIALLGFGAMLHYFPVDWIWWYCPSIVLVTMYFFQRAWRKQARGNQFPVGRAAS